ncbi:MAG: shikimate dehydrogenase [Candidatus Accumulibacter sp.]|jgi:shikimate dehydrogenase|nr:shikimate dehydrogenase [Accumulibacter sp.]
MLSGKTTLIAHIGYPTESFRAPMIYNPWFEKRGIDAMVVPMGVTAEDYPLSLRQIFRFANLHGALVTMPHKVTTMSLADEISVTASIAGAANALLKREDGSLLADQFDGAGFARGVARKGFRIEGSKILIVGAGGVGCPIAASLAAAGAASISLSARTPAKAEGLASRLRQHYPDMEVRLASNDPAGYDMVVNATSLGMKDDDPLPFDPERLSPETFVGEVVMKREITPLLQAAIARGCRYQIGADMLFEMIPAYLEFFGFGVATPEELREVARIAY